MKKIVIALITTIVVFTVAFIAYANSMERGFYKTLEKFENDFVKTSNKTFEGGIFKSKGSFDISISKEEINDFFALKDEDGADTDLNLRVDMIMDHGVASLFNGVLTKGEVEFKTYKEAISEIFDTSKPIKFTIDIKSGEIKNALMEIEKIDKSFDDAKIKIDKTFISGKFDKDGKILKSGVLNDLIHISDDKLTIFVKGASYISKYETSFDLKWILDYKFVNTDVKTNIKNISIAYMGSRANMDNLTSDTRLTVKEGSISQTDTTTIDKVSYEDQNFNKIVLKSKIENLDKVAIEGIINANSKEDISKYLEDLMARINQILQRGPKITFEEFSFKNSDSKKFVSNFEISINPTHTLENELTKNFIFNLMNSLNFKGEISIDTTPGSFMFKNLDIEKDIADQILLGKGIFIEDGGKFRSKFSYNKRTQDIVFNNKISLQSILNTDFR